MNTTSSQTFDPIFAGVPEFTSEAARESFIKDTKRAMGETQTSLDTGLSANPVDTQGAIDRYRLQIQLAETTPLVGA